MGFLMENEPMHAYKLVAKCINDDKVKVLGVVITKPFPPLLAPFELLCEMCKRNVQARRSSTWIQLHHSFQEM